MKKILIIVIVSIFYFSNAFAVTLLDALNQTFKNNIQLNAERENLSERLALEQRQDSLYNAEIKGIK